MTVVDNNTAECLFGNYIAKMTKLTNLMLNLESNELSNEDIDVISNSFEYFAQVN